MSKILGLDVGSAAIGVAISDALGWTAQGMMTIRRKGIQRDIHCLQALISEHHVSEIVVGMPLKMNGGCDTQTKKTLKFTHLLRDSLHIPIKTWDERFSTVAANKVLDLGHVSKKKKNMLIDKISAIIILQGYLDSRNNIAGL